MMRIRQEGGGNQVAGRTEKRISLVINRDRYIEISSRDY